MRSRFPAPAAPIALLVAVIVLVAHNVYVQPWTLDDAFISFRYAEHFSDGHGIVYNIDERVEGYTSFLWVFLLGVGHFVGLETALLAKTLGVLFALGTLGLVLLSPRFVPGVGSGAAAVAVVLLGTCGIFTGWVTSGMETSMVGFWALLSVLLHFRARETPADPGPSRLAGVTCALATMSHPEFGLLFLALFADRLLDGVRNGHRAYVSFGLAFSLVYVPYFAWRWWYYGWLFPNTYYAKVGSTWEQVRRGLAYTQEFGRPAALFLAPIAVGVVFRAYRTLWILPVWMIVHVAWVVWVGGDVFPAFRFFSPMMPVAALAAGVVFVARLRRPALIVGVVTVAAAFNIGQIAYHDSIHFRLLKDKVGVLGEEVGRWLRGYAPPDALLATNTAGSLPYYSGLRTIDMLGLTDEHIAHRSVPSMGSGMPGHEKSDGRYVLSREPDYIQFGSVLGSGIPKFPGDREIFEDPDFRTWYALRRHKLPSGRSLRLWERVDEPRDPSEWEEDRKHMRTRRPGKPRKRGDL